MGIDGTGVVVAMIDSGADLGHTDLAGRLWTNPGEVPGNGIDDDHNGYVDDVVGYDFGDRDSDPMDTDGHGTHTAGTVVGDGTAGTLTGVAPGATIMVCKVGLYINEVDEASVWEGIEYAVDNGAHVISMSLGWSQEWNPDRATWRAACENAVACGVTVVVAAGNERYIYQPPEDIRTPGDVPCVISVGATRYNQDRLTNFSSTGPVTWADVPPYNDHPYPPGLIKPDVCAPGEKVNSTVLHGGYSGDTWDGTSMATPHVAGTVALLLQSNPNLEPGEIKEALENHALDLGDPGDDTLYGMGRVRALDTVSDVMAATGTVEGALLDVDTLDPLTGIVWVDGLTGQAPAGLDGSYALNLVAGFSYTLEAEAFGHLGASETVFVNAGETAIVDFHLPTAPVGTLAGTVIDQEGFPIEGAQGTALSTPLAPATSGPGGAFTIDLPAGTGYSIETSAYGYITEILTGVSINEGETTNVSFTLGDWPPILIADYDRTPGSGDALKTALSYSGFRAMVTRAPLADYGDLTAFDALFVCLGVHPHKRVLPADGTEAMAIEAYLGAGGKVYLEGGDTWYWDAQHGGHDFGPSFGITAASDGDLDWFDVLGVGGTFTAGLDFFYTGEANLNDVINPVNGAYRIFRKYENNDGIGVARIDAATGARTIGTTFEFSGLNDGPTPSTSVEIVLRIATFFGLEAPDCFDEVCDGLDNDCDDVIDEGFDADGDGYKTCDDDCDDLDPEIHPGVDEVCDDGLDNNCDGSVNEGCGPIACGAYRSIPGESPIRLGPCIAVLVMVLCLLLIQPVMTKD